MQMRRPVFERWVRREVMREAGTTSYNLRKLAARAQRPGSTERFSALLLLSAYESGRFERLMGYIHNADLAAEYRDVATRLAQRPAEKLALRGTPMMSLPPVYRNIFAEFEDAFHEPEALAQRKRSYWEKSRSLQLRTGVTSVEVSKALELDPSNTSSYLKNGSVNRVSLNTAQLICEHLEEQERACA